MKDYKLDLTVKNGLLWQAMKDFGHSTVAELSRASGIDQGVLGLYMNLKKSPLNRHQELTPTAGKICSYFGMSIDELFPQEVVFTPLMQNKFERFVTSDDLLGIANQEQRSLEDMADDESLKAVISSNLGKLRERERRVLSARFGLDGGREKTYDDICREEDVTRERVRQIEIKALSRLRDSLPADICEAYQ